MKSKNKYLNSLKYLEKKNFIIDKKSNSLSFFYKGDEKNNIVNFKLINHLKNISNFNKKNLRINLHKNTQKKYHDMIILQRKNFLYPAHRHINKGDETIHLLSGSLKVILFNDDGKKIKDYNMDTKKNIILRIPGTFFHQYIITSNLAIYHENKSGPYIRNKDLVFPIWSK